jgi:hypothetical protein
MSIKGYWRLNGNSNDASGNGYNGTDTAITYSQANGRLGQGAGFNGSTSQIVASSMSPHLNGDFAISCWVLIKTYPVNTFNTLVCSHVNSYSNYWISLSVGGFGNTTLAIDKYDGTNNPGARSSTEYPQLNKWTHLVGTKIGSKLYLYMNGKLINEATDTTTSVPSYSALNIGKQTGFSYRRLDGSIDEVIIDSSGWTAARVKNEYMKAKGFF